MRRFLVLVTVSTTLLAALLAACAEDAAVSRDEVTADAGVIRRDAGLVDAPFSASDAGVGPVAPPSCERYCGLVMDHCSGALAQYADTRECLAFCNALPAGKTAETNTNTVGCRELYADSPARTNPSTYCLASGPFGGGLCDSRCATFCEVTLAACAPDSGMGPYPSRAACESACTEFSFRDAGADGGGESIDGPDHGDSLNCRLFYLRQAVTDAAACPYLGVDSKSCRD